MIKSEVLNKLFIKSLSDDVSEEERNELMKHIPDYSFSEGFTDRVINRISRGATLINGTRVFLNTIDRTFLRIAISGVAAIVILAFSIFMSQGSLSYDTLLGIDPQVDNSLLSLLVE